MSIVSMPPWHAARQLRVNPHQPLHPVAQRGVVLLAAQRHLHAVIELHGPRIAARQAERVRHQLDRREPRAQLGKPRQHFLLAAFRPFELRQRMVFVRLGQVGGEHIALDRQQPAVLAPGAERLVLFDRDDQLVGPLAPHRRAPHPGHRFERRAHLLQVGREKIALDLAEHAGAQGQLVHPLQFNVVHALDAHRLEREHRPLRHPPHAGGDAREHDQGDQAVGGCVQCACVLPHA